MNIIFLGTPEIAKICLEKIFYSKHKILAVVTKPDKPSGRGNKIQSSPVKEFALAKELPVYQFDNINKDGVEIIKKFKPDVLVLVAFGQILKQEILDIALPINLHPSLLPKFRGPSPVQYAILNGETESGVSIIKMAKDVDAGDILLQRKIKISLDDTSKTLFNNLAYLGGNMLAECLDLIEQNKVTFTSQDNSKATFTSIITKEDARLDFNDKTVNLVNKIRAYNPSPVAFFELDKVKFKVFKAKEVSYIDLNKRLTNINDRLNTNNSKKNSNDLDNDKAIKPKTTKSKLQKSIFKNGEIIISSHMEGLIIRTADGYIEILEIQFPNSAKMKVKDFLNGRSIEIGKVVN